MCTFLSAGHYWLWFELSMAVVIRLQGLPVIAGPVDIRHFFSGLNIPDGGVHIIGGEIGEAFIIFATDEDARRAMSRSGGFIKDSPVELFLSSKTEMQNTIEMKRKRFDRGGRELISGSKRPGSSSSGASGVGSLSNLVEAIKKGINKPGYDPSDDPEAGFHTNGTRHGIMGPRKETRMFKSDNRYLFLRGLPYSATEDEVRAFFPGLCVDGVILLKHPTGRNNGDCLVKFATSHDALGGLQRHRHYMGSRFVEVSPASEQQWIDCGGSIDIKDEVHFRSEERSPQRGINDAHSKKRSRSKSPRRVKRRSRSPHKYGFYVHLKNLSLSVEKRDIKNFFRDTDLASDQIKFLYKDQKRTGSAFVMFKTLRDYNSALALHKFILFHRQVLIDPISKKTMLKFIECYEKKRSGSVGRERPGHIPEKNYREGHSGPKLCIYIRNFPFDVTKVEVQKFFAGFSIDEDDVYLLYDDKGVGLGEALVKFKSEEQAMKAESLNRRRFLGTEVLLRLISEEQMQEFGVNISSVPGEKMQDHSQTRDRDEHSHSVDTQGLSVHSFGPPGKFRHPPEDFRQQPDNFRHPPDDFRHPPDRHPPDDFRHPPDRHPPDDFRHPPDRHPPDDFRQPDNFRPPPDDFMCPPDDFRGPRPFMNFGPPEGEPFGRFDFGNNNMGGFPEGRFMSDPNFNCGSGRVTPIKIMNLPFKANVNEILDFFHGYGVIPESVSIQYNEQGLPLGEAIVAMVNYDEAMAAINDLNDRPVGPRKVKLILL
ncbi:RNA-binding protein 12B isoform X4 [Macrotis lagotis]|uniref:RNA-binding protein 12B isoform X4 n=1 Tax=Macrotis lagotis TaxID=92651 RepID=UPI003D68155E